MTIVRNLGRRKLRSFLTITGIVIGIVALTTMGAVAANFDALLGGGVAYYGDHVMVEDSGAPAGLLPTGVVALGKVTEVERVRGVAAAFPEIMLLANPGKVQVVNLSLPDYVTASNPREAAYRSVDPGLASGRQLGAGARGEVVLGSSIASEFGRRVGDTIDLPVRPAGAPADFVAHTFQVVGVLAQTRTIPDTGAYVSLADAQMLLVDSLPAAIRGTVQASTLANSIDVYGTPGADLDALAGRVNAEVPGVKAIEPSMEVSAFRSGGAIFTAITTGTALLALVIGGLSVLNTMIIAVTERVREIGLKRAIGASTLTIVREVVLEATVIGFTGGAIGLGLGAGATFLVNAVTPPTQPTLFLVTPGLAALALGFATALGALAGLVPALGAARLDPVTALRTH
jgi:putative ABC transport system permease protein